MDCIFEARCFVLADAVSNHARPLAALARFDVGNQLILNSAA